MTGRAIKDGMDLARTGGAPGPGPAYLDSYRDLHTATKQRR